MAETSRAEHKLECAVDLVTDLCKMEKEAEEADRPEMVKEKEVFKIRPYQVKEMIHAFCMFDRNGDGVLDANEMASVFRALGQNPTQKELQDLIKEVDVNGDKKVDINEYVELLISHMQSKDEVKAEMKAAFNAFDRNGDGQLNKEELVKVLQGCGDPLTPREAEDLMQAMDTDKNGYIDVDEFTNFLCAGYPIVKHETKSGKKKSKSTKK